MNEVLSFLGLLNKGGKLLIGEKILYARKGAFMLIANDSGLAARKKFLDKAESLRIAFSLDFDKGSLGSALGYKELSAIMVMDNKAAKALREKLSKKGVTDI